MFTLQANVTQIWLFCSHCDSDLFLSWQCEQHKPHGIWSFQFRFVPLPYVVLNRIHVRCFAVMSDFMRLLRHSRSTFLKIPHWQETLKRFYIPKVIKTVAKGNQWKYSDVSELVCITVTTVQPKHEGSYHKSFKTLLSFVTSLSLFFHIACA